MSETLETVEVETGSSPRASVIWLHGLGADGHDFEPIVPELVDRAWPALRFVFPNATRTNLVMTTNLRALIHMSGLRLCTMAQWEIRRLFQQIRHEIFAVSPFLGSFLAPKCVPLGYCDEMGNRDEHCPIRPHKDNVLGAWAEKAKAAKAAGRELKVT